MTNRNSHLYLEWKSTVASHRPRQGFRHLIDDLRNTIVWSLKTDMRGCQAFKHTNDTLLN